MSRLLAALLAVSTTLPLAARAQQTGQRAPTGNAAPTAPPGAAAPAAPPGVPATPPPAATPPPSSAPAVGVETDPAVRELVRREVERAKEEMRDEVRAEIQGAQSAREFMETATVGDRPKLDFFQLHGYLRLRGDLFDNVDLRRAADLSGYYLFPRPISDPDHRGTLTSGNMRFRAEPTLNVSEQVRVLAQVDMLDNIVFGSTPMGLFSTSQAVGFTIGTPTQVPPQNGVNADRSSIVVKRAWGEVQTPVGLLSFGRMPSSWGLGILSHAGSGIDDDYGDSVDRLQFALTPLRTPIGSIVLVPMYEIVASGVTSQDVRFGRGLGQPFDRDQIDDAKALGIKIARMDTDEELKRKLDRDETSVSYGLWYMYKSQGYEFPQWASGNGLGGVGGSTPVTGGQPGSNAFPDVNPDAVVGPAVKRDAHAHVLDFWGRLQTRGFRLETEFAGIIGEVGAAPSSTDPAAPTIGPVLLRQFGGAVQASWKLAEGKLHLGGEAGFATGDRNPGFGNQPGRGPAQCKPAGDQVSGGVSCNFDGAKYDVGDGVMDVRNFRFNPAYRVDQVLWREIIGSVTGAYYLKPTVRYDLFEGLAATGAVVYSQAFYASSTPSTVHTPLGIELDLGLSYQSDDGFVAWASYGFLQPLSGMGYENEAGHPSLSRGHALRGGLAVKF